jgi:hypothetical protein
MYKWPWMQLLMYAKLSLAENTDRLACWENRGLGVHLSTVSTAYDLPSSVYRPLVKFEVLTAPIAKS